MSRLLPAPAQSPGLPLSHRAYLDACRSTRTKPWVQMRKRQRDCDAVLCGQVAELDASDGEWFAIDTAAGRFWTHARNVRLCSGDGRCTCDDTNDRSLSC